MMKDQKGITLVALIITIIVMLILVAVTISVALNGGLFTTAKEASVETKVAEVKEAVALAKAEALAEYYKNLGHGGAYKTAAKFKELINGYLDSTIAVTTVTASDDKTYFTVTATEDTEVNTEINKTSGIKAEFGVVIATP